MVKFAAPLSRSPLPSYLGFSPLLKLIKKYEENCNVSTIKNLL